MDPYSLNNLHFKTIESLSRMYMDFLVLIPTGYDATRNEALYIEEQSETVSRFTGDYNWRDKWQQAARKKQSFDVFICDSFGSSMQRLGYHYDGISHTRSVRLPGKNVLLYRLILFSRSKLGVRFWNESKKYSTQQRTFRF